MDYTFHHLHLICSNLDQMIDFMTGVLGATLKVRKMMGPTEGAIIDISGTEIYLRPPREGEQIGGAGGAKRFGCDHFGLVVDDIQAAYEELSEQGFTFTLPPTAQAGGIAFFKGPDGIDIELFQPA
ncbi:MAG: VOC family protein [Anaerolineales bacterium]|nr:VOC family protein [Anaerolineales bacterium]